MSDERDTSNEPSIFEGRFWQKIRPEVTSMYLPLLLVLGSIAFPILLLGTEKSKGNKFSLGLSEWAGLILLIAIYVTYYFEFGQFQGLTTNLAYSIAAGGIVGFCLAGVQRRASWILVGLSGYFYATVTLFFSGVLPWAIKQP